MKRRIRIGRIPYVDFGSRAKTPQYCQVEVEIELHPVPSGDRLTIQGEVWKPNRSDIVVGGQCLDTIRQYFGKNPNVARLLEIWERWHLNDMRAGSPAQEDALRPVKHTFDRADWYREACNYLESIGLLVDESYRVPCVTEDGHKGLRGYRYGTAWVYEPLPQAIIDEVANWKP